MRGWFLYELEGRLHGRLRGGIQLRSCWLLRAAFLLHLTEHGEIFVDAALEALLVEAE